MGCYNSQMKSKNLSKNFFCLKKEIAVLRECLFNVCQVEMTKFNSMEEDVHYIMEKSPKEQLELIDLLLCYQFNVQQRMLKLSNIRKNIDNDDLSVCSEYIQAESSVDNKNHQSNLSTKSHCAK